MLSARGVPTFSAAAAVETRAPASAAKARNQRTFGA
jgi:hypothetical protein